MHFDLVRRLDDAELAEVERPSARCCSRCAASSRDFKAMTERVDDMITVARAGTARYPRDEVHEVADFLAWLLGGNFVLLGAREYDFTDGTIRVVGGSGLGILHEEDRSQFSEPVPLADMPPPMRERATSGDLLLVTKTNAISPVHRHERMDYVGVRRVSRSGEIVGESRLLGLFTSQGVRRARVRDPAAASQAAPGARRRGPDRGLARLQGGRHAVRLVPEGGAVRRSGRRPAARRRRADRPRGLGPGPPARPPRRRRPQRVADPRAAARRATARRCRARERAAAPPLRDRRRRGAPRARRGPARAAALPGAHRGRAARHPAARPRGARWSRSPARGTTSSPTSLDERHGAGPGGRWRRRGRRSSPSTTRATPRPELAAVDVACFARLDAGESFVVGLHPIGAERPTRVALYKRGAKIELSRVMPMLEDLGLRVIEEISTRLLGDEETWVQEFRVLGPGEQALELDDVGDRVAEAIAAVYRGEDESDPLNRLVITAGLDRTQVAILRAYRKYRQRIGSRFTEGYQNEVLAANSPITAKLVRYFELRFDPDIETDEAAEARAARGDPGRPRGGHLDRPRPDPAQPARRDRRHAAHERVQAGPRRDLVQAALGRRAGDPAAGAGVRDLRLRVRRGGDPPARRRDRPRRHPLLGPDGLPHRGLRPDAGAADKNAIIVPAGAKGGFIVKRAPVDKEAIQESYVTYIRSLLDVTDNLVDGKVVHPERVRVRDDDDTYLVVAADKGTATFSDTANAIAAEYGFWLDDAFASGGSVGYDHKKLGITARGAWESVKRHFRELGRDPARDEFTVVGIGDMSGDVFGNGMLLSDKIKLLAAYDHRHVFIDPDPDPAASFAERRRLFDLAGLVVGRLRPRSAVRGRRRLPARREVARAARARAPAARPRRAARGPERGDPRRPALEGRPAVERRHRHDRQGLDRDRRRRERPLERLDPRERQRAARAGRRRGRQPRADAPRARRVRRRRRPHQRRLHRQLGRRRLLRPRGQPEDPARAGRAARRARRGRSATSCWRRSPKTSSRTCSTTRSCRRRSSPRRSSGRPGGCSRTRTSSPCWRRPGCWTARARISRTTRRSPSAAGAGTGSSAPSWRSSARTPSAGSRASSSAPASPTTRGWSATCARTSRTRSSSAAGTCWASTRCALS